MAINYFDEIFFWKYLVTEEEVLDICHKHVITITDDIILWMFFWVILPAFFYFNNSFNLQIYVDFLYFEIYLFLIYIFLIYRIFDWYNDVWIITNKWIIDLDWQLLKTNIVYIDYSDVRWIEIRQHSMWDWLLWKWQIYIHLEWENADFSLEDARNPSEIVWYIQWILEDREKSKNQHEENLNEKLLSALRWVVWEYLEKEWLDSWLSKEEEEEEKSVDKALKRKWTVDLREIE